MAESTATPAPQTRKAWTGSTKSTREGSGMLGGKWWEAGDELHCIFQRVFETKYGDGYEFMLVKPSSLTVLVDQYGSTTKPGPEPNEFLETKLLTRIAIPPLAGFEMAVQGLMREGFPGFRFGDRVIIKCSNVAPASDFDKSPMPEFELSVDKR